MGGVKGHGGTYAEYILADQRLVAPKPANLDMREAAALPLVTITAAEALQRSLARYDDGLICLMHEANPSTRYGRAFIDRVRRYALFARDL